VIELGDDRIDGAFEIGEIDQPAGVWIDLTAHGDFSAERMSVDAAALMTFRHIRKEVCSLEAEVFHELDEV
jgi:hypothetical protein